MAKIMVHVWHKVGGEIVAVGRPIGKAKCVPLASAGHAVLETQVEEEHLTELHRTHVVDVSRKALIRPTDTKR